MGPVRAVGELLEAKVRDGFLPWVGIGILLVAPLTIEVKPISWCYIWLRCCECFPIRVIFIVVSWLNRVPYLAFIRDIDESVVMDMASRERVVGMGTSGTVYDRLFNHSV